MSDDAQTVQSAIQLIELGGRFTMLLGGLMKNYGLPVLKGGVKGLGKLMQVGITAAARKLYVSQPALSRMILDVEKNIGAELFVRERGNLHLTREGEIYLDGCREVLAVRQSVIRQILDHRDSKSGSIRLGVTSLTGEYLLPRLLPQTTVQNTLVSKCDKSRFKSRICRILIVIHLLRWYNGSGFRFKSQICQQEVCLWYISNGQLRISPSIQTKHSRVY